MNKVVIDVEFQGLIPPLAESEFMRLERKILAEGCTERLKVWRHGGQDVLIDGHNRLEICRKHGIPFDVEPVELKDRGAVKRWMIENQLGRRNANSFVNVELAAKLVGWSPEKADENRRSNLKNAESQICDSRKQDITQEIADIAGVSKRTVTSVLSILRNGTVDTVAKARAGEVSISQAYNVVRGLPDGMLEVFRNVNIAVVERLKHAELKGWKCVDKAIIEAHIEKDVTALETSIGKRGVTVHDAMLYRWESLRQELLMMKRVDTSYLKEDNSGYLAKRAMRDKYHWELFPPKERLFMRNVEHGAYYELDKPYTAADAVLPVFYHETKIAEQFNKDGFFSDEYLDGFKQWKSGRNESTAYVERLAELIELDRQKACALIGDGGDLVATDEAGEVWSGGYEYTDAKGNPIKMEEKRVYHIH